MNRRNFFKVVTGFVAGIFATNTVKAEPVQPKWVEESFRRQSICRPKPAQPGPTELPNMTMSTSSNNVEEWTIRLTYWDKDEPDIYTFKDGKAIIV